MILILAGLPPCSPRIKGVPHQLDAALVLAPHFGRLHDRCTETLADLLVTLGLVVMTIGVYVLYRMPDVYTQSHASSKTVSSD